MKQYMIRVPEWLMDKLEKMAKKDRRSRSNLIRLILEKAVNQFEVDQTTGKNKSYPPAQGTKEVK